MFPNTSHTNTYITELEMAAASCCVTMVVKPGFDAK